MLLLWCWMSIINMQNLIAIEHDQLQLDHLNQIYVIQNDRIIKFDQNGNQLAEFSDELLGEITSVDVSDPLRILVFYQDFNQIIYLNKELSKIGSTIDLYDYNDNENSLVCSSQNGGFWMYNSTNSQSFHISSNGTIKNESILLNGFFENISPIKMIESENLLYFLYPQKGILILNENGQLNKKIDLRGIDDIYPIQNKIYYQKENIIFHFNITNQKDMIIYQSKKGNNNMYQLNKRYLLESNRESISIKKLSF